MNVLYDAIDSDFSQLSIKNLRLKISVTMQWMAQGV